MYRQVAEALLREIKTGKYPPGQKLPSEAALVKRFGTSRITVGRALRELKQTGLVHGVAGAGNFVQAAPGSAGLGNGGTAGEGALLFGLLIPNLGETEIFEPICQGIASASQTGTYALLWGHTPAPSAAWNSRPCIFADSSSRRGRLECSSRPWNGPRTRTR